MNKKRIIGNILLLVTALIWGSSFVAQVKSMENIGPFTFVAIRNFIAAASLVPVIFVMNKIKKSNITSNECDELINEESEKSKTANRKTYIIGGICCGIPLFMGSSLQQIGLLYTSTGKAGFITTLYIVIVPIIGLFLHKKIKKQTWIGIALATIGLYMLCVKEGFSIDFGDFIVFIGAFFWASHILIIDYFSPKTDGIKLSCFQFIFCGIFALLPAFIFENILLDTILLSMIPILYAGIMSSGVAYTLQIIAQKNTDPTIASLLLSTEAVFATICGFLILNERLTLRELLGCCIMFTAVIITQLPERKVYKLEEE
ncbi:DMT family transporter [Anaerovorax odorimutans]|uniref:DMT family transporter n=1 Tax=Anaerovorax odorimutans TaxID=109327 RepID=UPI00040BD1E3|nr:DMT family transporter [Anaerovorax odorimutans]